MPETATIRERPIPFAPELVRKIIDGQKRATRRPVVPQPISHGYEPQPSWGPKGLEYAFGPRDMRPDGSVRWWRSPFGRAGERLYVRENFALIRACYDSHESIRPDGYEAWAGPLPKAHPAGYGLVYEATDTSCESARERGFPLRPSIHMPRWASRLTLTITSVAVEPLLDITDAEIPAEGAESREAFLASWGGFYGKAYPAESDPWTWVYTFEPLEVARA